MRRLPRFRAGHESAEQTNGAARLKPPKSGRARTVALAQTIMEELRA
jgi:hypothetical protein